MQGGTIPAKICSSAGILILNIRKERFMLTDKEKILRLLRAAIDASGNQTAWARRTGVNEGYLSQVLNGRVEPTDRLLRHIGYRRVLAYEPLEMESAPCK
jgi:hypothetical protein